MKWFPIIGLLLTIFLIGTIGQENVRRDEARMLWLVRDITPLEPASPSDSARAILTNVREMLSRAQNIAQPPLYPLLLDGWTMMAGGTAFVARYFSLLCVLVGVTASALVFVHITSRSAASPAVVLLATSLLVVYPARNVTHLSLFFALAALSTLVYLRGRQHYGLTVLYVALLTAALYTDMIALWLLVAHLIIEFRRPHIQTRWLLAAMVILLLFGGWLFLVRDTLDYSLVLNRLLLAMGLLLLPLILEITLALAAWRGAIYALALVQLTLYVFFVPPAPRWLDAVQSVLATRHPLEPAIMAIAPDSPAAYYDQQFNLRRGISVDLGWRRHPPAEIQAIVSKIANPSLSVWVMMPTESIETWDVMTALSQTHDPHYYDIVDGMVFYRFDPK